MQFFLISRDLAAGFFLFLIVYVLFFRNVDLGPLVVALYDQLEVKQREQSAFSALIRHQDMLGNKKCGGGRGRTLLTHPTNIGITRGTVSVAILVAVRRVVDIWVALRFSYH